jgi:tRNA (guanine-N7-)-methyltransferase
MYQQFVCEDHFFRLIQSQCSASRSFVCRARGKHKGEIEALLTQSQLIANPLDWRRIAQINRPIILEVGFGMGDFLLQQAQNHTDRNYIGIEVHRAGIIRVLKSIVTKQIENLKIIYGDAAQLLKFFVSPQSIDAIQILFPDPWPKTRHHKRRLIQPEFISTMHRALKHLGRLHIVTDWDPYARHIIRDLSNQPWQPLFDNPINSDSGYESKFAKKAKSTARIWDLIYQKIMN